jgi:hypothetical protein
VYSGVAAFNWDASQLFLLRCALMGNATIFFPPSRVDFLIRNHRNLSPSATLSLSVENWGCNHLRLKLDRTARPLMRC